MVSKETNCKGYAVMIIHYQVPADVGLEKNTRGYLWKHRPE